MQEIYFYALIICGVLSVLYAFFGDLSDAGDGVISFSTLLAFLTLTSAGGFLFHYLTSWNEVLIVFISMVIASILTFAFYYFLLVPLSSAETSVAYSDAQLAGQTATVIVPIPSDGFGEILVKAGGGNVPKRAAGWSNEEIEYGKEVLIVDVKDGTFLVQAYVPILSFQEK
ncbi:hypothetical protein [Paenisporosarcina cavernae]|nr:hypothetical protein [Paenisporosarcina cavernae]